MTSTINTTLNETPEALNGVRVNDASDILLGIVLNPLMSISELLDKVIAAEFVSEYSGLDAPYIEFVNADRPGSQLGTEINFSAPLELSLGSAYDPFTVITQVVDGRVDL